MYIDELIETNTYKRYLPCEPNKVMLTDDNIIIFTSVIYAKNTISWGANYKAIRMPEGMVPNKNLYFKAPFSQTSAEPFDSNGNPKAPTGLITMCIDRDGWLYPIDYSALSKNYAINLDGVMVSLNSTYRS